jgi:NNP family nitrate/nitrite transporter-like MFS transporter
VLKTRSFWLMILLFALGMGAQVGVYTMLPLYLTAERGMTADGANTLVGLANIAPVVTVFVAGWLTSKFGEKRVMGLALLLTGVVTVLVGALSGIALKICVVLMAGLAVCFFPPAFAALSRIVQPTYRSLANAAGPPTAFVFGGGLLPMVLGYVGQAASFSLGIIIIGGIVVVGSSATLLLRLLTDLEEGC